MMGRGTDIKPKNETTGLYVLDTYITSYRDYRQIIGRSGRNGMKGLSELILSEEEFTKRSRPVPETQAELSDEIKKIQTEESSEKKNERTEKQAFSDVKNQFFLKYVEMCRVLKADVTESFKDLEADSRELWDSIQHDTHFKWEGFLNQIDGQWNELITDIRNELAG